MKRSLFLAVGSLCCLWTTIGFATHGNVTYANWMAVMTAVYVVMYRVERKHGK